MPDIDAESGGGRQKNKSVFSAELDAFLGDDENVVTNDQPAAPARFQSLYGDRTDNFTKRDSVAADTTKLEKKRRDTLMRDNKNGETRRTTLHVDNTADVTLDGQGVFKNYDHTKPANTVFRWNLLWLVLCLIAPFPFWMPFVHCKLNGELQFLCGLLLQVNYVFTTVLCWRYMWRMIRSFNTPYWQELDEELREKVQHIVIMPTYKEPLALLMETISSISNQTVASSIIMVVGMEEGTPDQEGKKKAIRERFGKSFKACVFAVHPKGTIGEIPGACSNRNYAARAAVKYMIMAGLLPIDPVTKEVELDFTTCTVCDADTTFFYRYFENFTWSFLNESPDTRYTVCWQSPLFYNITLDERWFFTRVMGILRTYFMVGFLIGGSINTMSIYSMSLRLLVEGQFFHPGYQMDDIIYTLSAMRATGGRVYIRTIDIPTLSGPTSGVTMMAEFEEWCVQAERWTIGAAEVFHYFFVKLLKGNYLLPGLAYFWWFVYYYGYVLCIAGLIQFSGAIMAVIGGLGGLPGYGINDCKPMEDWFNIPEGFDYDLFIWYGYAYFYGTVVLTAFCMDALLSQILALDEKVHPIRNLLHFISAQPVLWVYCLVEYKAIFKIAIYGKSVCGHKASDKSALA